MANQPKRRGLEAAGAQPARAVSGEEFDRFLRLAITRVAQRADRIPAPETMFYELARDEPRSFSMARIGHALQALAASPLVHDRDFFALAESVAGYIRGLRPGGDRSLHEQWADETQAQADADVVQAKALGAVERRDVAALDAAIAETTEHLGEQQRLLAGLVAGKRRVVQERRAECLRRAAPGGRPVGRFA